MEPVYAKLFCNNAAVPDGCAPADCWPPVIKRKEPAWWLCGGCLDHPGVDVFTPPVLLVILENIGLK